MNQKERREKSNQIIKGMGIACLEELPMIEDSSQVKLKNIEDICKRAIACLISTQVACDIASDNYEESIEFFKPLLESYGVSDELNSVEKRIFNGSYSKQDAIDIDWEYETYWALVGL